MRTGEVDPFFRVTMDITMVMIMDMKVNIITKNIMLMVMSTMLIMTMKKCHKNIKLLMLAVSLQILDSSNAEHLLMDLD